MSKNKFPLTIEQISQYFPVSQSDQDIQQRNQLWKRFDFNNNGSLSLFEIQTTIQNMGPKFQFLQNSKDAQKYAFNIAQDVIPTKDKSTINKEQFRIFLIYLRIFFQCQVWFQEIDENNDRRLSLTEFKKAVPKLEKYLSIKINDANQEFQAIDKDKGGFINFQEFADFCIKRNLNLDNNDKQQEPYKKQQSQVIEFDQGQNILFIDDELNLEKIENVFPTKINDQEQSKRKYIWKKLDSNGDGMLTYKQVSQGFQNFGKAYLFLNEYEIAKTNAFNIVVKVFPNKNKKYLYLEQLRLFLLYLKYYFQIFLWFETIDFNNSQVLSLKEFKAAIPMIEQYWGKFINNSQELFEQIDLQNEGIIQFNDFADFAIRNCKEFKQFDAQKEEYINQLQFNFTTQKLRNASEKEKQESEKYFNFSDESDSEQSQVKQQKRFNFQIPDFQVIQPTQQDQPIKQEQQFLQQYDNFEEIFFHFLDQTYKMCNQISKGKYLQLGMTIYPYDKVDKNKSKSELVSLAFIKFIPFLGEKVLNGFYQCIEAIKYEQIVEFSKEYLNFFSNLKENQILCKEIVKILGKKFPREISSIDDQKLKQWMDKIKLFGIMLEVKIFSLKEIENYIDTPLKQFSLRIFSQMVSQMILNQQLQFDNQQQKIEYLQQQFEENFIIDFQQSPQKKIIKENDTKLQQFQKSVGKLQHMRSTVKFLNPVDNQQTLFQQEIQTTRKKMKLRGLVLPQENDELYEIQKKIENIQSSRPSKNPIQFPSIKQKEKEKEKQCLIF